MDEYRVLVRGHLRERDCLEDPGVDGRIIYSIAGPSGKWVL